MEEIETTKETVEKIGTYMMIASSIMVSVGVALGSFIKGTILIAVFGAFFVVLGVIIFIISQFIEERME